MLLITASNSKVGFFNDPKSPFERVNIEPTQDTMKNSQNIRKVLQGKATDDLSCAVLRWIGSNVGKILIERNEHSFLLP